MMQILHLGLGESQRNALADAGGAADDDCAAPGNLCASEGLDMDVRGWRWRWVSGRM